MLALTGSRKPVHLYFAGGKVLITPDDAKRFHIAAGRAVKLFYGEKDADDSRRRFQDEYLPRLYAWCQTNRETVRACFLGVPTLHGFAVFVVGRSSQYHFALGSKISEFALDLEEEGWPSNIIQIPHGEPEDLLAFFDPESALEVYAQPEAAPGEGGA